MRLHGHIVQFVYHYFNLMSDICLSNVVNTTAYNYYITLTKKNNQLLCTHRVAYRQWGGKEEREKERRGKRKREGERRERRGGGSNLPISACV